MTVSKICNSTFLHERKTLQNARHVAKEPTSEGETGREQSEQRRNGNLRNTPQRLFSLHLQQKTETRTDTK